MSDGPDLFETAVRRHSQGRLEDAETLYAKFLETHAGHADALHLRGMALYQLDRYEDSAGCIRKAIEQRPDRADFYSNLGLVLKAGGDHHDAIEAFSQALALKPEFPEYLNNMATAYLAAGHASDAADILRRLVDKHPDFADGHNNLAVVLMTSGDLDEARGHLQRAIELKADYLDAICNLGRVYSRQQREAKAADAYRRALQLDDANVEIMRDFVEALLKSEQLDEARAVADELMRLAPRDPENLVTVGNLCQAVRDYEKAEDYYRQALGFDERNVRASNNLGTLYVRRGQFDIALTWFLAAIKGDADFVEALFNAGSASQQAGNLEAAEQFYKDALARRPDLPRAYRYLAEIYRSQRRAGELRDILREWLRQCPDSAGARHMLAASGEEAAPERASDDYIREEFDDFADQFDETLAKLRYKTPELICEIVRRAAKPDNARILDAGCGTGLCGPLLKPMAGRLVGVDLSHKMLERAAAREVYDELVESELTDLMISRPSTFDLVVSTDTLVYFGALRAVFEAAAETLERDGWLAFSVEELADDAEEGYRLGSSGRYQHSRPYVTQCLREAGFSTVAVERASLRLETNAPVRGLLVLAQLGRAQG